MKYSIGWKVGEDLNNYKSPIVELAGKYLVENSLIDLTGFLHNDLGIPENEAHSAFVRDVANRMKRSGKYEIIEQETGKRFLIYPLPKKPLRERYWLLIAILAYVVGLVTPSIQSYISEKIVQEKTINEVEVKKQPVK